MPWHSSGEVARVARLRVLQVINSLPIGGAERLLVDLIPAFTSAGIESRILVLSEEGDAHSKALEQAGASVRFLGKKGTRSPFLVLQIAREIRRFQPAVVHGHLYPAILWSAAARSLAPKAAYLLTEHNTLNRRMDYAFLQPVERWLYRRYDAVAAISPAVQEALEARLPPPRPSIKVIPNGVELSRFASCQPSAWTGEGGFLVVMAARFNAQKDQATVLRALALLPDRFRCAFAGDGEELGKLRFLSESLGLGSRVDFLGPQRDIPGLLGRAQAYVQSSHWEGFGLAAIEAMAAGLPVLASDVPGLAELVKGAGLVFPAGDEKALATSLLDLAGDPGLHARLSQAGRPRAAEYSIGACAASYASLYKSLAIQGCP